MVVIYPSRNTEQSDIYPHRTLLDGEQFYRIYLDELGNIRELPVEVAVMLLTTVKEEQAPEEARYLLQRTQQEPTQQSTQAIIELITTIISYKFVQLSRKEVEEMLGITFEETQFYKDIKQEGVEEGEERGEQRGREKGERNLILRLLTRRVGELSQEVR